MTWGRGLLRLWLVLSVMWIAGISIGERPDVVFHEYRAAQMAYDAKLREPFSDPNLEKMEVTTPEGKSHVVLGETKEEAWENFVELERLGDEILGKSDRLYHFALFALLPPGLTFAIGTALLWVIRGFVR